MSAWSSRIAQGVLRTAQDVICHEMIVDDDAVSHGSGHFATLLADAVVRVYGGGGATPRRLCLSRRHARGTEAGGGEQIGHGFADPVLGDPVLHVEIERFSPRAWSVCTCAVTVSGNAAVVALPQWWQR
jgi:hypothetical protein